MAITKEEYWKNRCLLAEKIINESPCDPDIYDEQIIAWNNYTSFLNEYGKILNEKITWKLT